MFHKKVKNFLKRGKITGYRNYLDPELVSGSK
jgi:hypothetical protein